jgi:hypothetical protein
MNPKIEQLLLQVAPRVGEDGEYLPSLHTSQDIERFAELIVEECASEYNKLINGEAVVLPKDREHAEALVRVGMFYLENNK